MTTDGDFDWCEFLGRWQAEWVPDEHGTHRERLGGPPAPEAAVVAAERRLGTRLPPSYRKFLTAADGWWVDATASVYRLGGVGEIDWFGDPYGLTEIYEEFLDEAPSDENRLLAGMWRRALRLETESDMSHALLDPGDVGEDGEWALYVYQGWSGDLPDRYPSFRAYMEARYRAFHADRAGSVPGFENATTRAQDANVERAREEALRGHGDAAAGLLAEAWSFGRPGSAALLRQLTVRPAVNLRFAYAALVTDPRYTDELLPVLAAAHLEDNRYRQSPGPLTPGFELDDAMRAAADDLVARIRDGVHRYEPGGAFGRAVAEAREAARWGDVDGAWRTIRAALPSWSPPGPALVAPVGLTADSVLRQVVTPERWRELVSTPRAGRTGPAPEPAPDVDPPGLRWLVDDARNRIRTGYRCLWVEGTDPAGLPGLIGEPGGTGLSPQPVGPRERVFGHPGPGAGTGEPWEDRAVLSVGRTASGWTFGFEEAPAQAPGGQFFASPAAAASAQGRCVTLWVQPARMHTDRVVHLSVAERGREQFAFTVRGEETETTGEVPAPLDPARLFEDTTDERRLLAALETEFALSLPRFALTDGALHRFTTHSWTRAPREGEGYAVFTWSRLG
ncbi:SMI1/KNR4 family protein [Streptomyces sp. JHA26]|uniref:SMI1/KNR4 family protein n=1 Tax=Streptomyces sp. JHA26 TaxID=1917143 RepID=UPI00098B83D7|nr:SMI1/KNR4 family protein [Streptomyces sp. JHA26]